MESTRYIQSGVRIPQLYPERRKVLPAKCPDCGGRLIYAGGCAFCPACGWDLC